MYAYPEIYIDEAALNLGEMFDYTINELGLSADAVFYMFAHSDVGRHFEAGNPSYTVGISGIELARKLIFEIKGYYETKEYMFVPYRTPEYWAGWALAYYQWYRNVDFEKLYDFGITASRVISMYILHEADITKFYDVCDNIIESSKASNESMLRRLRKYHNMTQKQLSEKSGVSLRMIQLYEQGQNDISKAQAQVVYNLANSLDCTVERLLS